MSGVMITVFLYIDWTNLYADRRDPVASVHDKRITRYNFCYIDGGAGLCYFW